MCDARENRGPGGNLPAEMAVSTFYETQKSLAGLSRNNIPWDTLITSSEA